MTRFTISYPTFLMACILCTFWTTTYAFSSKIRHGQKPSSSASFPSLNYQTRRPSRELQQSTLLLSSVLKGQVDQVGGTVQFSSADAFNDALASICKKDKTVVEDAMRLLQQCEEKAPHILNQASYTIVIQTLAVSEHAKATEWAEELLQRMKDRSHDHPQCLPTADAYNAAIFVWSKSSSTSFSFQPHQPTYAMMTQQQSLQMAAQKCTEYLSHLWSLYNSTSKDPRFIPFKSSYISTITALSRSRGGRKAAERAEELLEEMERLHVDHPHLAPTTICCNIVLKTWGKSGDPDAAKRCEVILDRMEDLYFQGRKELCPDTRSFNTVIDALARSRDSGSARRAEALLERMEELATSHKELAEVCHPDVMTFNSVLYGWARSQEYGAANRATAILRHMERRFASNSTTMHPNEVSYASVINAWALSKEKDAVPKAEQILQLIEDAHEKNPTLVKPAAMAYNSMINVYSKSDLPDASARALLILGRMKVLCQEKGREDCSPDYITYTSIIDTLAKKGSADASKSAAFLLTELEREYTTTGNRSLKPNVKTYTSVINAIGRSGSDPTPAEDIVNRMEGLYRNGDGDVQPDVVTYNALMNAYGWSTCLKSKSSKCYGLYQRMIDLYESRTNRLAKPDIITCNSILNACAFEKVVTESERAAVMQVVAQTLEDFQSSSPTFGYPNYLTYSLVLLSISRHMPVGPRRTELSEATFWQCCRSGQLSTMVVIHLHKALPWSQFSTIMGFALKSTEEEKLGFDLSSLPAEWTRYAPGAGKRKKSRPSRRQKGFEITKEANRASFRQGGGKRAT